MILSVETTIILKNFYSMEYKGLENYKKHVEEQKARKEAEKERAKERRKKKLEAEREKKKRANHRKMLKKKRDAYKPIKLKNQRRKQNRRAYLKRREVELAERRKNGDVFGYYRIILAKNHKMTKELSPSWWMGTAYQKYNDYIEENRRGVICEKRIAQSNIQDGEKVKYEILLLKKINPEEDDGVRNIRSEGGVFIENRITNNEKYAIIAKSDWYIPETYNVFGYNPVSDRKTGRWIFDNIINKDCCRENIKNVFMLDNKLIVQYDGDVDFILCKNTEECMRLYNGLEGEMDKKNKFVFFTNTLVEARKSWLYNLLEEKTGWSRDVLYKKKG